MSEVLKLIAANGKIGEMPWHTAIDLLFQIETAERKRIEVQDTYLPRKLMRMSDVQVDAAKLQLERHGMQLMFNGAPTGSKLWVCVAVNVIETGLLSQRSIHLLPMADGFRELKYVDGKDAFGKPIAHPSLGATVPLSNTPPHESAPDTMLYASAMQPLAAKVTETADEHVRKVQRAIAGLPADNCEECPSLTTFDPSA